MSNILIALVTLVIAFVLAGYGVYATVESSRRSNTAMVVGSALERQAGHMQDLAGELGRMPRSPAAESSTGYASYNPEVFTSENTAKLNFLTDQNGSSTWVCAETNDLSDYMREAFQMVVRDRPGSVISGRCGYAGTAITTKQVVSLRVGG